MSAATARDAATPRPAAVHAQSSDRDVERPRGFVDAEAGEIAQFDDAALAFVDRGEAGERLVQCQHVIALAGRERGTSSSGTGATLRRASGLRCRRA